MRNRQIVPAVRVKGSDVVQDAEAYQCLPDIAARVDAEEGIRQGFVDSKKERFGPRRNFLTRLRRGISARVCSTGFSLCSLEFTTANCTQAEACATEDP